MKHPQRLRWARANFRGKPPSPRCGHTAVSIGHSKVVFFGGFVHDRFLNDIFVYDIDKRLWYTPECTGSGSDGQAGPCPRAFHVAVSIDNKMYIFGGRSEKASLGDLWVLDTGRAVWQWSALISFGDMPCPREFSSATVIGNSKILMYGGWDGSDCLSDLHVLDTQSLDWKKFTVAGLVPSPRCGHSATVIDNMLVIFGGRGANKSIFADSWALNGIAEEEYNGGPTWTELNLSGHSMHARCGHSVTSGEHHLLLFGGHGTDGWREECIILHMGTQWIDLILITHPGVHLRPPGTRSERTDRCLRLRKRSYRSCYAKAKRSSVVSESLMSTCNCSRTRSTGTDLRGHLRGNPRARATPLPCLYTMPTALSCLVLVTPSKMRERLLPMMMMMMMRRMRHQPLALGQFLSQSSTTSISTVIPQDGALMDVEQYMRRAYGRRT